MNKEMNFRVFGFRGSQIGDMVGVLIILNYIRYLYLEAYTIWQVARKHVHAASLFYNHELIDRLTISDYDGGYVPKDIALAKTCTPQGAEMGRICHLLTEYGYVARVVQSNDYQTFFHLDWRKT